MTARALAVRGCKDRAIARCPRHDAIQSVSLFAGVGAAIALPGTLVLLVALALAVYSALGTPTARRLRARCARRVRQRRREHRLDEAGAAPDKLADLEDFVADRLVAGSRDLREIDDLLDRFAELTIERQRCITLLRSADRARLERRYATLHLRRPRTAELLERRIAHTRHVEVTLFATDTTLGELGELIRYAAERASTPAIAWPPDATLVTDVLDALDADRAAEAQARLAEAPASSGSRAASCSRVSRMPRSMPDAIAPSRTSFEG